MKFPGKGDGSRPGSSDGLKLKGKKVPGPMGHRSSKSQSPYSKSRDTARVRGGDDQMGAVRGKGFSKR